MEQTQFDVLLSDPGALVDGDLRLRVRKLDPGNSVRGWVPAYGFDMEHVETGETMGMVNLRVGNPDTICRYVGHVGYRVAPEHRGRRLAARAVRLLFPLAVRHGLDPLWITCNPENMPSRRTCELAGGTFVEILDLPEDLDLYRQGERKVCRYRFDLSGGDEVDSFSR